MSRTMILSLINRIPTLRRKIGASHFFPFVLRVSAFQAMSTTQLGSYKIPTIENEMMKSFAPQSPERSMLLQALEDMRSNVPVVPCIVNGIPITTSKTSSQIIGCDHQKILCKFHTADSNLIAKAIDGALQAKKKWENMPLSERCTIFLKAAELLTKKYRYQVMAATMLGQGKTTWQAEIDAIAELADFWRFNCQYAEEIYSQQPLFNSPGTWNKLEYRPLEGFIYAVSPFNFTAIGGNLCSTPALMGNVVIWKPSHTAIYSNYLVYQILMEAGLPPGVIQFVPGPSSEITKQVLQHKMFAGLHFTGSTSVFKSLWKDIAANLDVYLSYPRIVGETGGKNMHFVHKSADLKNVVYQTIRSAFENQGQKCSACSRIYVPASCWDEVKTNLIEQTKSLKIGPVDDMSNFLTAVIDKSAFDKCASYIEWAKSSSEVEIIVGGKCCNTVGYYIYPTIIESKSPSSRTMVEEIFGPILTVFVYPDEEYEKYLTIASETSSYGLTAAIFANDREAIMLATSILRHSAGNFYINDKCTGAVVAQQPFGGGRQSGTNDKAGSLFNLLRWVSPQTIKENFNAIDHWIYPSCL